MNQHAEFSSGPTSLIVPRRPFGNTGVSVSKLCFGGSSVMGKVTSICSRMPNVSVLQANASAAMDEHPLDGEVT